MGGIPALSPATAPPASVVDGFVEAARRFPGRIAVRSGECALDYRAVSYTHLTLPTN